MGGGHHITEPGAQVRSLDGTIANQACRPERGTVAQPTLTGCVPLPFIQRVEFADWLNAIRATLHDTGSDSANRLALPASDLNTFHTSDTKRESEHNHG